MATNHQQAADAMNGFEYLDYGNTTMTDDDDELSLLDTQSFQSLSSPADVMHNYSLPTSFAGNVPQSSPYRSSFSSGALQSIPPPLSVNQPPFDVQPSDTCRMSFGFDSTATPLNMSMQAWSSTQFEDNEERRSINRFCMDEARSSSDTDERYQIRPSILPLGYNCDSNSSHLQSFGETPITQPSSFAGDWAGYHFDFIDGPYPEQSTTSLSNVPDALYGMGPRVEDVPFDVPGNLNDMSGDGLDEDPLADVQVPTAIAGTVDMMGGCNLSEAVPDIYVQGSRVPDGGMSMESSLFLANDAGYAKPEQLAAPPATASVTSQGSTFDETGFPSHTECEECGLHYKNNSHRTKHIKMHTKPYVCKHCDSSRTRKAFSTPNDLVRHTKSVHRIGIETVWKCAFTGCQKTHRDHQFDRRDNFSAHIKRRHPELPPEEVNVLIARSATKLRDEGLRPRVVANRARR